MTPLTPLALALISAAPFDAPTGGQEPSAPGAEGVVLELWPAGVPGAPVDAPVEVVRDREEGGDRHVSGVHQPNITAYLPAEGGAPRPAE